MFDYIKKSAVSKDTTSEYQFRNLRGRPVLVCSPATTQNKAWLIDSLNEPARPPRKLTTSEQVEEMRQGRLRHARRIAKTCVASWRGVVNDEGEEVAFSIELCTEFLEMLASEASWMFDEFLMWISEASNFVQTFDAGGVAKNSEPG
jgi:hypothetical protein